MQCGVWYSDTVREQNYIPEQERDVFTVAAGIHTYPTPEGLFLCLLRKRNEFYLLKRTTAVH